MSKPPAEYRNSLHLRLDAERLIAEGVPPSTKGWVPGVEALSLLHKLASAPTNATDALKLLHELQVYQVELDLQHEQMEQNRQDLVSQLERYAELYDAAPVAYFNVDFSGKLIEGNLAAAQLLGIEREQLCGRAIESFLAPVTRPLFLSMLSQMRDSRTDQGCIVQVNNAAGTSRATRVIANRSPDDRSVLIVFIDASEEAPGAQPV